MGPSSWAPRYARALEAASGAPRPFKEQRWREVNIRTMISPTRDSQEGAAVGHIVPSYKDPST